MNIEDLIIGVHGGDNTVGGRYNVLSSFPSGLLKGFQNIGVKAFSTKECFEKGLTPNLTVGFNVDGYETWSEYLKLGIPNIMWSAGSVFYQNIEAVEQFMNHPNFFLFEVSPSDSEALKTFYPSLKHAYVPHAVDLDLWKKKDLEKEFDIVFLSSIYDYEAKIVELQQTLPKAAFELLMMIYKTWLPAANLSFWQVYQIFQKEGGLNLDAAQYGFIFKNLVYLITYSQRAQMIDKLQDFNVKVFGDGPWEKYVKGKVQYMGKCDLIESIDVVNKSKIVLHQQPAQLTLGLHERILNACATETFVMSTINQSVASEFHGSIGFFNFNNIDLTDRLAHYLQNDEERITNAQNARKIVAENHTWDRRAKQILNLLK